MAFPCTQINGNDMTEAHHDAAVACLTEPQRFVRLVLQREYRGPLEPPTSPRSPAVLNSLSPSGYLANRPGGYPTQLNICNLIFQIIFGGRWKGHFGLHS